VAYITPGLGTLDGYSFADDNKPRAAQVAASVSLAPSKPL